MALDSIYRKRRIEESKYGYEGIRKETRIPYSSNNDLEDLCMSMEQQIKEIEEQLAQIQIHSLNDIKNMLETKYNEINKLGNEKGIDLSEITNILITCYKRIESSSKNNQANLDIFYDKAQKVSTLCEDIKNRYFSFIDINIKNQKMYRELLADIISEINSLDLGPDTQKLIELFQNTYANYFNVDLKKFSLDKINNTNDIHEKLSRLNQNFIRADELCEQFQSNNTIDSQTLATLKHTLVGAVMTGDLEIFVQLETLNNGFQKPQTEEFSDTDLSEISKTF